MADSLLGKLKRALQGAFFAHIPDHPAHGGNTGDTEWPPEENEEEETADSNTANASETSGNGRS